jgi:hypothetical protein
VVANVLAGTLIELAPRISALVAPGGRLALSGILADQADGVLAAYRAIAESRPEGRSCPDANPLPGRSASLGAIPTQRSDHPCQPLPNPTPGGSAALAAAGAIHFAAPIGRDGWVLLHGVRGGP